jgi:hypothetical protein
MMNAQGMARRSAQILAGAAAVAALSVTAPAVTITSAAADDLPTYTCEFTTPDLPTVDGRFCQASGGAPEQGPVAGPFVVTTFRGMPYQCQFGVADIPESVKGFGCEPVDSDS